MVPHLLRLSRLPGVAALAWRFHLPVLRLRRAWRLGDGRYECVGCHGRTSVTAGTIFDRTRTPLTAGFTAGLAVRHGQGRDLGAEPAAVPGDRLVPDGVGDAVPAAVGAGTAGGAGWPGRVEVDETCIGGEEPGLRGGRARGKKVLTGIAVEVTGPRGNRERAGPGRGRNPPPGDLRSRGHGRRAHAGAGHSGRSAVGRDPLSRPPDPERAILTARPHNTGYR